jgi:hypothetical protein
MAAFGQWVAWEQASELDYLIGPDTVMDVLDADLAGAHVAALGAKVLHTLEGQLAQVSVLDARGDQGHGDVPLDAVHARPRRNQGQDFGHQVDQGVGVVVFVLARLPQLVEPRPANHQRWIKLESVRAERRILKELLMIIPTQPNTNVFVPPNLGEAEAEAKANSLGTGMRDAKRLCGVRACVTRRREEWVP